ncbi:hypothetical protein GCM10023196_099070 [Actinoallomurus vinaceus]|uniref:IstB-like ATP-binding domain-containing protein n=1 Tax=Actinoallomurus vinaceus TaxID=1080074 RepID=A0ABP8USY0_9ACTN
MVGCGRNRGAPGGRWNCVTRSKERAEDTCPLDYQCRLPLSTSTVKYLADLLRRHLKAIRSRWRILPPGRITVIVLAVLRHDQRLAMQDELVKLSRIPVLVVDEVGYIPFEPEAANLFFQLVSSRYERASLIVTSNKPFGRWGEVFGDDVVAAAMIDRLVHHAEVISLKGDSYRLKNRDLGRVPAAQTNNDHQ